MRSETQQQQMGTYAGLVDSIHEPRACIGWRFAILVMKSLLIKLILNNRLLSSPCWRMERAYTVPFCLKYLLSSFGDGGYYRGWASLRAFAPLERYVCRRITQILSLPSRTIALPYHGDVSVVVDRKFIQLDSSELEPHTLKTNRP